jgi:acetylornithine deacetylase/succinyl-diaminopimelate desuccinylase-like protein
MGAGSAAGVAARLLDAVSEADVVATVSAMCAIPSVSGHEDAIGSWASATLRGQGFTVVEQEVMPGRRNVIATLETGRPGPALLFNGHLDTLPVPTGDPHDPYRPRVENGRLHGAEVNNMKAAVGGMIVAMTAAQAVSDHLQGTVMLSAVIGECDALGLGTAFMLDQGLRADCCINGEPTDRQVMTAHAGVSQLRLVVEGRAVHVCQRERGVNAIDKLVALLPRLTIDRLRHAPHAAFPGLPTLNVGTVSAGTLPSMLAGSAEAWIDVRTVPGMTPEGVRDDIAAVIAEAASKDPDLRATVTLAERPRFVQQHPFYVDDDAPIVRAVAAAHQAATGQAPRVGTLYPQVFFGTDSSHLLRAGIPTAIYGPGKVSDINTADESMAVADAVGAARTYALAILDICGRDGGVRA